MISIKNISINRVGKEIIHNFTAQIEHGAITAITGPNGCGKSTLLAAIAGDLIPASGEIKIDDRKLSELSDLEQAELRSVLLQDQSYWLSYSVQESLELGQSKAAKLRIYEISAALEITELLGQSMLSLSVGQAQRVEIARVLIRDTPILLLDEPLAAQDVESQARIIELLRNLKDSGKTVVIVVHANMDELKWCDYVIEGLN